MVFNRQNLGDMGCSLVGTPEMGLRVVDNSILDRFEVVFHAFACYFRVEFHWEMKENGAVRQFAIGKRF